MTSRLLLVAALAAGLAEPAGAAPCPARAWSLDSVVLRSAPGLEPGSAVVEAGTELRVLGCDSWWAEVRVGGERGWLELSRLGSTPPAAEGSGPLSRDLETPPAVAAPPAPEPPAAKTPDAAEPGRSVAPRRPLLLRTEPRWAAAVAGRSPAGRSVRELDRRGGWSLVDAGQGSPAWVVTAALRAPALTSVR